MVEIIGHRAYRGKYPENSLVAFNKAYEAKCDIIETDVQLTNDGVVVINHDSDTGRMWDQNLKISEVSFDELSKLTNKYDENEKFLTLEDILNWLLVHDNVRLMLDIKFTNNKIILVKIFSTMMKIKNDISFWQKRIIWGLWLIDWYEYAVETGVIKGFDFIVITMSLEVAEQFINYSLKLNDPNYKLYGVSLHFVSSWTEKFRNILVPILQKNNIKVFLWTVNSEIDFSYFNGLPIHGTISDDPQQAREYVHSNEKLVSLNKLSGEFVVPQWTSLSGIRFHTYIYIHEIIDSLLFSKWAHFKIFGLSFAMIMGYLLRLIHFF